MEGLEKLERVQRTIHLLHSVGISDANPDSERFLAHFTFVLMEHCAELDITSKCQLVSKHISKISTLFVGGALQCGGKGCRENDVQLYNDDKTNLDPLRYFYNDVAMVGIDATMRSNSTLEDFCRSYFMFHKMEANQPQSIFRYLPMLSFTESYIYQISIEDVKRAIHLKSFDYRVLNLLLYQLRGEKVNELHMEFLSISELLVEVSDDLFDYEDDVVENSFNVLRMFVKCHGASAAPIMMAKFITEAEEKYDQLFKELGPELSIKYQKRCEEATKEGGKKSGPSLGTWHIPPVIEDETRYRTMFSISTNS